MVALAPTCVLVVFACAGISQGLVDQNDMPVAIYEKRQLVSREQNIVPTMNQWPMVHSSATYYSFGPDIDVNPISMFWKIVYYGQYLTPAIFPIVFCVTSYGRSLHCLVALSFSIFFISEYFRTGFYPFLPFALNFSDYYPRLFSCLFLMVMEHLSVGAIAYHFSTIAWSPDGPAWREAYGFHKRATFSTIEILLGWDPSPYYAHVFVFSYAVFKYFGYISLEYKARRNASRGAFTILMALVKLRFVWLALSRIATLISGFILIGLFVQFLYDILSTNEVVIFFSMFIHMTSQTTKRTTLVVSLIMLLLGLISHLV